jgi:hypothetical protein
MRGVLIVTSAHGPSSTLRDLVLAATPSPSPSTVSSDSASALPNWLLIALFALVAVIVLAMFAVTAYNLSAPRSPLKRLLKRNNAADSALIGTLATSARPGIGTTRTTLAIAGFSLLGVAVIAIFGLSGQGVRDLRSQVVASITTLIAAIAGFYFGTRAAQNPAGGGPTTGTTAVPTVTGISPTSGQAAGGDTVTVTGTGFTGATGATFGTVAASAAPVVASDTSLTVTSPPGTAGTTVDVTVTTPAGTSAATAADQFTYAAATAVPAVKGVSPTSGQAAGGDTVTVTGTGFTGATGATLGTVAASAAPVVASDTSLTVTSPPGTAGTTVDVTVTTPAGTSAATAADQFTYR